MALVTGASRGIGEAIAVRLGMEGAKIVVSARTAESGESRLPGTLNETVERVRKTGADVIFIKADLAQAREREMLIEKAQSAFGPIDILINNAAITFFTPVAEFTEKRFKLMLEVQVYAPFHLAQLVLPSMKARKSGWIVNISSPARPSSQAALLDGCARRHCLWHVQGCARALHHGTCVGGLR